MKNINVCLLAAVACTYSIQVSANSLEHNLNFVIEDNVFSLHSSSAASHTVTPLELKPMLISDTGVKLAAVCALGSGGCDGLGFGTGNNNIDLDESAQCRDEGFVTSCPSGYVPDTSQKCPYNNSFFKCRVCSHTCNSGSLTTCNSSQVETGSSRNDCNETCYTCRAKTCEEGGYASSITSCQKANAVSFAGKTCYSGVSAKTCADGGYSASVPTNQVGQSTNFCGNTCYYNIRTPACSEGGHRDNIPVNQVCTTTPYYGQTCYSGCYTPTCSSGGYVSSCPANQIGTSVNYYGQNCYSGCNQPQCSAGGYVDACPANQVGSSVSYYGRTCYSGCYTPTCSAGGYVDACPSGQTGTTTPYYGRTCYQNCKSNDYVYCDVGTILYADKRCSDKIISGNTPIGVVFDNYDRFALALVDKPRASWGCYSDVPGLQGCRDSDVFYCNTDGKYNTAKIVESCLMSAAHICDNYSAIGTRSGDWFLPSMYQLDYIGSHRSEINATLSKLGGETLKDDFYWSSNPSLYTGYAWKFNLRSGTADFQSQYESNYIRPVISF